MLPERGCQYDKHLHSFSILYLPDLVCSVSIYGH